MSCSGGGFNTRKPFARTSECCPDKFGCCPGVCPDFELKRHDTMPAFVASVSDCNGPLELEDCVVEASMWAKGKLKRALTASATEFSLADDIGFEQSLVGDIVLVSRVRSPEMMLVIGHDETEKTVQVVRGYHGTSPGAYPRGTRLRLFRMLNAVGELNTVTEAIDQLDGTTIDMVTDSQLVYKWRASDTCLPGCYQFEYKLLKMATGGITDDSVTPSMASMGCSVGYGVEWVRRFPVEGEGFLIRIIDSPTSELLL